ncbi:DNA repair protein RadC [Pelagicoccus sp. NFK12]|uniref:DNA repair protein RadC n=1 Tax=Pelagicoccus enzymogenes TaxID=2773457 RepID=A0A927II32_9BACT|nr:DNA repair protein RadC [Pelagicoccus enzymogenes]MBD5780328.1 DNA repair protein RadC [Pelagicoccus enzymogenes]MDQ8197769.1 DNA repair protein RadC [Pelagicoccus enzymogenes]
MPSSTYLTPRLADLSVSERPQERLESQGPQSLSDSELLAMILRSGSKGRNVLSVASEILQESGSLNGLLKWSDAEFRAIKGIGKVKALQLITIVEICRRVRERSPVTAPILDSPDLVFDFMRQDTQNLEIEKFWTLCLNRKNRLIKKVEVTSGTASNSLVHPREVFREAIRQGASAVICAHNHPSGDPSPSAADIKVTRQLRESAKIVGIDLLDHLVVGNPEHDPLSRGYYSFQESGLL